MKSGTSSVWHGLRQHPDVFMPEEKELNFFKSSTGNYQNGIKWYEQKFEGHDGESAVGEASPRYMAFEEVPRRVHELNPDMRFIFVLRDPVDRAYSHYWHMVRHGIETLSFEEAVDSEADRIQRSERDFRAYSYVTRGYYGDQLATFTEYFDRDQLHVGFFEEFVQNKQEFYRDLFEFLEVESSFIPEDEHKNQGGTVRSRYLNQLLRGSSAVKSLGKAVLPKAVARAIADQMVKINTSEGDYPPMEPELRAALYRKYAADTGRLESIIEREVPWREKIPASCE